jgi:hypothetical protein
MHAGFSFSYSPISVLLRQPLSIKKSYAGAVQQVTVPVTVPVPLVKKLRFLRFRFRFRFHNTVSKYGMVVIRTGKDDLGGRHTLTINE